MAMLAIAPFALSERGLVHLREIGTASPASFAGGYVRHLLPRTLFSGDVGQGFLAKGVPPLHAFEAPLVLVGLAAALRVPRHRFLLGWLAAFPFASAFTLPAPNLLRAIFGLPLFALLGARIARDKKLQAKVKARIAEVSKKTEARRRKWAEEAKQDWDASPITLPRLASEVWAQIRNEDWVLTAGTLEAWTRRLWDFDKPYRHPGKSLGTSTQLGISLGVALANFCCFSSPEVIFLFGGLAQSGEAIFKPVRKAFEENVLKVYQGKTKILW